MFDKIGYADVNYWPSGYFEDNDYCRRALLMGAKAIKAEGAWFFHFWSRAAFETNLGEIYGKQLQNCAQYYFKKWGGMVGDERFAYGFMELPNKIPTRAHERTAVDYFLDGAK